MRASVSWSASPTDRENTGVPLFSKVLVANRGEIAIRIFRTLRELGGPAWLFTGRGRRVAPLLEYADEAWGIGGAAPAESYLMGERIIDVARRSGAEAIHPGYGSSRRTPASSGGRRGGAHLDRAAARGD